ncbi:MAG: hypothetical protein AAF266_00245 [Planctomycetota bacterium]
MPTESDTDTPTPAETDRVDFDRATTATVTSEPSTEPAVELSDAARESSTPFVGQWNELVSTTNWEKGRLISKWRETLRKSGAHVTEYSDEAWSRLVAGVTSQHVGRLRRAHERFGSVREQYPGLYWSHFQAALDWDDAEMWLEGAISNSWSVSQMRAGRWEAVGGPTDPSEASVVETQIDEDAYQSLTERDEELAATKASESAVADVDSASSSRSDGDGTGDEDTEAPFDVPDETAEAVPRVQPFKDLAKLPDDVADAFEQFKLVILSHKLSGWDAIARDDLLGVLESLKVLAVAPSADD